MQTSYTHIAARKGLRLDDTPQAKDTSEPKQQATPARRRWRRWIVSAQPC